MPGRTDSVVVGFGKRVVFDPPGGTSTITLTNVSVSSLSSVETKPGTVWKAENEIVSGSLIHRSTDASTDLYAAMERNLA